MKKLVTFLVFLLVLACSLTVFADYQTVDIYVNGDLLVSDSPAVLVGSRTMVPLRAISEKLGCDVGWDAETQTAEIKNAKTAVYVTIDSDVMVKKSVADGTSEDVIIDAPAMLYMSRTLIPLRAVSEALDAKVDWDSERGCALITTGDKTYYGVVTEDGYESAELGLKFIKPEGCAVSNSVETVKVSEWTDDIEDVDAESVVEFIAMDNKTRTNLTFTISPKTSVEVGDYLEFVKESLEMADEEMTCTAVAGIKICDIAGHFFERLDFVVIMGQSKVNISYYTTKIDDRMVTMIIGHADDEAAEVEKLIGGFINTRQ